MKKLIFIFSVLFLFTNAFAGEKIEGPKKLSGETEEDSYIISFENNEKIIKNEKKEEIYLEINIKDLNSKKCVNLKKALEGNEKEKIEIKKAEIESSIKAKAYEIKIRYLIGKNKSQYSNSITLGEVPIYNNYSDWAKAKLDKAQKLGILSDKVRSDMKKEITREEFAELLVKTYEKKDWIHVHKKESPFSDCDSKWANAANELDLLKGYNNKFYPNKKLKKYEGAIVYSKILNLKENLKSKNKIKDISKLNDFAKISVENTVEEKIFVLSKGKFYPEKNLTREEVICQLMDIIDKKI